MAATLDSPVKDRSQSALGRAEPGPAKERRFGALRFGAFGLESGNAGVGLRAMKSIEAALWATHPAWGKVHLTSRLPRHWYPIRRRIATERVMKFVSPAR